jgi:hypothetical protein
MQWDQTTNNILQDRRHSDGSSGFGKLIDLQHLYQKINALSNDDRSIHVENIANHNKDNAHGEPAAVFPKIFIEIGEIFHDRAFMAQVSAVIPQDLKPFGFFTNSFAATVHPCCDSTLF